MVNLYHITNLKGGRFTVVFFVFLWSALGRELALVGVDSKFKNLDERRLLTLFGIQRKEDLAWKIMAAEQETTENPPPTGATEMITSKKSKSVDPSVDPSGEEVNKVEEKLKKAEEELKKAEEQFQLARMEYEQCPDADSYDKEIALDGGRH